MFKKIYAGLMLWLLCMGSASAEITEFKLTTGDGVPTDRFGMNVSMDGDYAVVGAYLDDDKGSDSGSAYVFKQDGGNWIPHMKLTADSGGANHYFGAGVGISGDYIVVYATGANQPISLKERAIPGHNRSC